MTYDNAIDISKEDALRILQTAEVRAVAEDEKPGWIKKGFPARKLREEILLDGTWRLFCRTDECDDVCTTCVEKFKEKTPEEVRRRYVSRVSRSFGVRLGPKRFAVIDSCTDG